MGCFLIISAKDFAQLKGSMLAGVTVGPSTPDWTLIRVNGTINTTIRELARQIRHAFPSVQVEKYPYSCTYDALLTRSPYLAMAFGDDHEDELKSERGSIHHYAGKSGEIIASKVLLQNYQDYELESISEVTGVDVTLREIEDEDGGKRICAEVKMNCMDDLRSFDQRLKINKSGNRESSDDWFRAHGINPENIEILGVELNLVQDTVTLYRRIDGEAREWEPIHKSTGISRYK